MTGKKTLLLDADFDSLVRRFGEPEILVGPDAPGWRVAVLRRDDVTVSGKGQDARTARKSCLGEAAEVFSALRRDDDIEFDAIVLPSLRAERVRAKTAVISSLDDPLDPGTEGLGAGATPSAAKMSAVLERIERAIVADWWSGDGSQRRLDPDWVEANGLRRIEHQAREGARHLRATTYLSLGRQGATPVIAAMSRDESGAWPVLGFAAHSETAMACRMALSELFQMELALALARISAQRGKPSANSAALRRAHRLEREKASLLEGGEVVPHDTGPTDLAEVVASTGVQMTLIDLTRAEIGMPVFRAFAPDLSSARPLKFDAMGGPL